MLAHRNSTERRDMLAARRDDQESRVAGRFTPMPRRRRLRVPPPAYCAHFTKRHTDARINSAWPSELDKQRAFHQRRGLNLLYDLYARVA